MTRAANIDLPSRIFAEAQRVVVTSGYQGINMRRLASQVGISATTIYNYYKNKDAILRKLRIWAAEVLNDQIRAISPELSPDDFLAELGRRYLAYAQEHPNLYRLLFEAPLDEQSEAEGDHPVLYFTYLAARKALEKKAKAGNLPLEPRYGAMMGWIMLHGFSSLLMSGLLPPAEGMSRDALREIFLSFYASGGEPTRDCPE
jgi:AcrR family transcriptional regulator